MDEPCKLMQVRDEIEGDDVCEQLRAAGIKCAVEPLTDANSFASIWALQAPTVLMVLVNESDLDKARGVLREHQEWFKRTGESDKRDRDELCDRFTGGKLRNE